MVAASLLLAHCSANGLAPDNTSRAAAVARVAPFVQSISAYSDKFSVVGAGQNSAAAMQAADKLGRALVPGSALPVATVLRAVKSASDATKLPNTTVGDFLNTHIFVAANVESVSGDTTTYLLHGDVVCSDGNNTPATSCVDQIDQMAIRLVNTVEGSSQKIAVRVGTASADVITATYDPSSQAIGIDADLAQLQTVLSALGATSSAQSSGHVSLAFAQPSAQQATATFGIPSTVTITAKNGTSSITIAAAPQAYQMSVDGTTWSAKVALAGIDSSLPRTGTDGNSTTPLKMHLAGLTGGVKGDASSQGDITLEGVGLGNGPSALSQDDKVLLRLEINANANHTFDVTVGASDANGAQVLSLSPGLDATLVAAMAPLSAQYKEAQELLSNHYTLAISNNGSPVQLKLFYGDLLGITSGSVQLINGQAALGSDQSSLTLMAGQCLERKADTAPGPSWVAEMQAGTCADAQ